MIKTIPDEVWAFDCEWIPDLRAGRSLYDLPEDMPDDEVLRQMWAEGGATQDNPMPFLKTAYCRVVSIAALIRRRTPEGRVKLMLMTLPEDPDDPNQTEKHILARFLNRGLVTRNPQLVGYNSRNADLRILAQRSLINGLPAPEFARRLSAKPWESQDIDLMEMVSGFGKNFTVSLNDIARLCGIPGKLDMNGNDVCAAWYSGRRREIVEYNTFDALTTYLLWLRLALWSGVFSEDDYKTEQGRVRKLLLDEIAAGKEFLETFLQDWQRRSGW